jgi:hypothetical protein
MSDDVDLLHANAGLNLLAANMATLAAPIPVHDGVVPPNAPRPYVLVYTTISRPIAADGNALDGRSSAVHVRWICHCVGETQAASRAVGMQVRISLLDIRPTITGRACDLIREETVLDPTRDETTGVAVMDQVRVYTLQTLPG